MPVASLMYLSSCSLKLTWENTGLIYLLSNRGPETQENNGRIQKHIRRYHGNFGGIPSQTLKGKKKGG